MWFSWNFLFFFLWAVERTKTWINGIRQFNCYILQANVCYLNCIANSLNAEISNEAIGNTVMLEKIQCRYLIPYNSHNRLTIIVLKKSCYTWWQKHTQKLNECSFALFFLHVSSYVIWNFEKAQRMFKCSHQM